MLQTNQANIRGSRIMNITSNTSRFDQSIVEYDNADSIKLNLKDKNAEAVITVTNERVIISLFDQENSNVLLDEVFELPSKKEAA